MKHTLRQLLQLTRNCQAASVLLATAGYQRDHTRYMAAPIAVCHRPSDGVEWLPGRLVDQILHSRLEQIFTEGEIGMTGSLCTAAEVFGYMYYLSSVKELELPECRRIWLWLAGQVCAGQEPDYQEMLTLAAAVNAPVILSGYEQGLYESLAWQIRSAIVQHAAKSDRQPPKPNPYLDLSWGSLEALPQAVTGPAQSFKRRFRRAFSYH